MTRSFVPLPQRFALYSCFIVSVLLITGSALRLHAQAVYPVTEAYLSFAVSNNEYGTDRLNSPGVQFSAGYNPHRLIRLTGEFSGFFHGTNLTYNGRQLRMRDYQLLFGPEFVFRNQSRVSPFVHVLAGYATRRYAVPNGIYYCTGYIYGSCSEQYTTLTSDSGFGTAVGGGLDVDVHPVIALRVVQFDYFRSNLNRGDMQFVTDQGPLPVLHSWQKNYRIAFGIVFKLGERGARRY